MVRRKIALITASFLLYHSSSAQNNTNPLGEIHGNFEINAQYYNEDTLIGAPPVPEKMLSNAYSNVIYTRGAFTAGIRYESYLNVMQGFDPGYKGAGIAYRFASYTVENLEITVGNYYEQFGSGLVLRAYEEKGLGFDNCFDGVRLKMNPYRGVYLKALVGQQRIYFSKAGLVRGFDGEINFNEFFTGLSEAKTGFILGGSFVSKFQTDDDPALVLPQNVGAWAARFNITRGNFSLYGEYAYKINDPSYDNGYIYKYGDAMLLQANYSKKGLGISLAAKRIDNMSYKSDRDMSGNVLTINYNPVLTKQHTYTTLAMYPYNSQNVGEFCYQADFLYKFRKETPLGGKYGTDVALNFSSAHSLDTTNLNDDTLAMKGYTSDYMKIGDKLYFQDVNIEINKKFSPKLKMTLIYAYQVYNIDILRGKPGYEDIQSHIIVVDVTRKLKDDASIRFQAEHLATQQHNETGDASFAAGLVEWTISEHWFIAAQDVYSYANINPEKSVHYWNATVGYLKGTNRIVLGYGKQRAGIFCVGGVCRYVPASNGITLTVSSSF
ncbi:MAG: DUF6029 family protein [Bacteroidota bacterium]